MNVVRKGLWRVTGYHTEDSPDGVLFEAYFTDSDTAHAVYHKGEREYGVAAGYTKMRWSLTGMFVDDDYHIDQMFNDVREAMEE